VKRLSGRRGRPEIFQFHSSIVSGAAARNSPS
jgi:hypothetical protein